MLQWDEIVNSVIPEVEHLFSKFNAVILVPPGSGRGKICKHFKETGKAHVISYLDEPDVEAFLKKLDQEVKKNPNGKLLIIPRDTHSVLRIVEELQKYEVKPHVLNLAKVYQDKIKKVEDYLKLDYFPFNRELKKLKIEMEPDCKGISLKLWNRAGKEEIVKAVESIKSFSPERIEMSVPEGMKSVAKLFGRSLLEAVLKKYLPLLIVFGGVELTSAAIVLPVSSVIGDALLKTLVRKYRSEFKALLVDFLVKVQKVEPCIRDELYEGAVDCVAANLGLSYEEFKSTISSFVKSLRESFPGKEALTREDIDKIIEDGLKELEKRLKEIEKRIDELSTRLSTYRKIGDDPYVKLVDGRFFVTADGRKVELAVTERYRKLAEEVMRRLKTARLVILKGSSGSGKSTLAHYVAVNLLKEAQEIGVDSAIYEVRKSDEVEQMERVLPLLKESGTLALIIYDPAPPRLYAEEYLTRLEFRDSLREESQEIEKRSGEAVKLMQLLSQPEWGNVQLLIVMPTSFYEHVKKQLEHPPQLLGSYPEEFYKRRGEKLKRLLQLYVKHTVDFDEWMREGLGEFVREVLKAYSGCENIDQPASIIEGFKGSHALVAKYAGLLLKERECHIENIHKMLEDAKGEPKAFIESFIKVRLNLGNVSRENLLKERERERLRSYARILALREPFVDAVPFGAYIVTPKLMQYLLNAVSCDEIERNYVWLSIRNEDLVEEVLKDLLDVAREHIKDDDILRKTLEVGDAAILILSNWGNDITKCINDTIANDDKSRRRAIYILGSALSGHFFSKTFDAFKKVYGKQEFFQVSDHCEVDNWLLVEDEVPLFIRAFLLQLAVEGHSLIQPAEQIQREVEKVGEFIAAKRDFSPSLVPYLAGLALTSLSGLGSEMRIREAAYLLRWSLTYLGPLANLPAICLMLLNTGERLDWPQELVPILFTILGMYGSLPGTLQIVSGLADKLYEKRGGMDLWAKARLAEAHARLAALSVSQAYVEKFYCLLGRVMSGDEWLGWLAAVTSMYDIVEANLRNDDFKEAERSLCVFETAKSKLERVENFLESRNVIEYLKWRSLKEPRKAIEELRKVAERNYLAAVARINLGKGLEEDKRHLLENAANTFSEVARLSWEMEDKENYLIFRGLSSRARFLLSEKLDENVLGEFGEIWRETMEGMELSKVYTHIAAFILAEYLVALALMEGAWRSLLEEQEFLLRLDPRLDVATRFMLSILAGYERMPNEEDVRKVVPLRKVETVDRSKILMTLEKLGIGGGEIEGLSDEELWDLLAPKDTFERFILLLKALSEKSYRIARLHALVQSKGGGTLSRLYKELADALEECGERELNDRAKLALAKLYYYHL